MVDVISLNSSVSVFALMVSFKLFISFSVSEIVSLQNWAVSFINSIDKFAIFPYHLFINSGLWFPIVGSISIRNPIGMSFSFVHVLIYEYIQYSKAFLNPIYFKVSLYLGSSH